MKMATGSGKTTVMAMLIAWQAVNAARKDFEGFLPRLPDRHARHHDQGSASRAAAERAGQLLRDPRDRAAGNAAGDPARGDRHHQLSRLPASRDAGLAEGRAQLSAGERSRAAQDDGNGRGDAGAGLRQAAQLRPRQRHQRRGPPLLSPQGRRRRRGRADRRRQEGGGRERGSRAALDQRHRGAGPQAVEGRARGLRPLGHALLPARFGLSRGLSLPLGRVGFQPDGRDRERHRQAAARAGERQPRRQSIRSSTAISGSTSARTCPRPPRAPPSSAPSTCPPCSRPG